MRPQVVDERLEPGAECRRSARGSVPAATTAQRQHAGEAVFQIVGGAHGGEEQRPVGAGKLVEVGDASRPRRDRARSPCATSSRRWRRPAESRDITGAAAAGLAAANQPPAATPMAMASAQPTGDASPSSCSTRLARHSAHIARTASPRRSSRIRLRDLHSDRRGLTKGLTRQSGLRGRPGPGEQRLELAVPLGPVPETRSGVEVAARTRRRQSRRPRRRRTRGPGRGHEGIVRRWPRRWPGRGAAAAAAGRSLGSRRGCAPANRRRPARPAAPPRSTRRRGARPRGRRARSRGCAPPAPPARPPRRPRPRGPPTSPRGRDGPNRAGRPGGSVGCRLSQRVCQCSGPEPPSPGRISTRGGQAAALRAATCCRCRCG